MITLYKEYTIGVKKLSDAELNRDNSPSGQTVYHHYSVRF